MLFHQKTVIITGAGQGIGFEIARQLCRKGAVVILNDIDPKLAASAAEKIVNESGGNCIAIGGDAGDLSVIQLMTDEAMRSGGADIVIANAGITVFGSFLDFTEADFTKLAEVNLKGNFFLAQAAAKQMIRQKKKGSILFTSSVTGHQAHKNLAAYGMSKAALEMLAKQLVAELSPYQIRINAIAPGATLTERTLGDSQYAATWSKLTPLGKAADVSDIAATALFLVSDEAKHITGQTIVVDGGWTSISPSPYE